MKKICLLHDESGGAILEFIFYFPAVFLLFLVFIVSGMLITQRVVLDYAVARATTEAAAFFSSDQHKVNAVHSFSGQEHKLRANPYARMLSTHFSNGEYFPFANRAEFDDRIKELVLEYSRWGLVGGWAMDEIQVNTRHNNYIVARDITVTASHRVAFPLLPGFFGWNFQSSSSVRVFQPYLLINDVSFVFDVARYAGLDVRNVRDYIGTELPGMIQGLIERAIS